MQNTPSVKCSVQRIETNLMDPLLLHPKPKEMRHERGIKTFFAWLSSVKVKVFWFLYSFWPIENDAFTKK